MTRATCLLFLICFLTCQSGSLVWSFLCAQCRQTDPGCRSGNILPTQCGDGERHCYILHIYTDRRQGTFRGCIDRYDEEGCRLGVISQRDATICKSVCDWEGCNSSHGVVSGLLIRRR